LPTTTLLQHHRFLTPIPPKRLDRHRSEHSAETLNTANHRGGQHKTNGRRCPPYHSIAPPKTSCYRRDPPVGWALPTTTLLQHHRFLTPIPPKRLDRHRSEHSDETLNTANHRGGQHKTNGGRCPPYHSIAPPKTSFYRRDPLVGATGGRPRGARIRVPARSLFSAPTFAGGVGFRARTVSELNFQIWMPCILYQVELTGASCLGYEKISYKQTAATKHTSACEKPSGKQIA